MVLIFRFRFHIRTHASGHPKQAAKYCPLGENVHCQAGCDSRYTKAWAPSPTCLTGGDKFATQVRLGQVENIVVVVVVVVLEADEDDGVTMGVVVVAAA